VPDGSDAVWLGAERDKLAHFRSCMSHPEEDMPRLIFLCPAGQQTMGESAIR